ncbi:MAG: hypothetical protein ACLT2F_05030 [Butyricicoccus sp.]
MQLRCRYAVRHRALCGILQYPLTPKAKKRMLPYTLMTFLSGTPTSVWTRPDAICIH